MKKVVVLLLFFSLCLSSVFSSAVHAQEENPFIIDTEVNYDIHEDLKTEITHEVTLTNRESTLYAKSYTLVLEGIEPQKVRAYEADVPLNVTTEQTGENTVSLNVTFEDALVGKDKKRQFRVIFSDDSLVTKNGEVWEVTIPRLTDPDAFASYQARITVPDTFGELSYVYPEPTTRRTQSNSTELTFSKSSILEHGVNAVFGEFQVFEFDLTYRLENPLNKDSYVEIAIPPDTAYQKVTYTLFEPKPTHVRVDDDGNWLARIDLSARERKDVHAVGVVQVFSVPTSFPQTPESVLDANLKAQDSWQINDETIQRRANDLKTPRAIYNYIVDTFSYDYDRVRPNVDRLGAVDALKNPDMAICMEFTDTFVALARAAGIPAREINGYAYTENPQIQPLSLVADVLHSWPEYWDIEKKVWVPVDPTWGNTSGADYFDSFDLRHVTFVIHGIDDKRPYPPGSYKLGPNPQKDVFVSFGTLPPERMPIPEFAIHRENMWWPFSSKYEVTVRNPGPQAISMETVHISLDDETYSDNEISVLPPFSDENYTVTLQGGFLGHAAPRHISVSYAGQSQSFATSKDALAVVGLLIIFLCVGAVTLPVYIISKKAHDRKKRHTEASKTSGKAQGNKKDSTKRA